MYESCATSAGLRVWISKPWDNPDPYPKRRQKITPMPCPAWSPWPRSGTPQLPHIYISSHDTHWLATWLWTWPRKRTRTLTMFSIARLIAGLGASRANGLCVISARCDWSSACEKEAWTCWHKVKDQPWQQIEADLRCKLLIRCS